MRELARHLANKNDLLLYAIGLLALLLSFYIASLPGADAAGTWTGRVARLAEALGYTLIITTLVTAALHYSFTTVLHARFQIVGGAEGAQIMRIFRNRAAALTEINSGMQRVISAVDVLCISGTDLLQPHTPVLTEIGRRCIARSSLKVRLLLLDPRCRFAVERSLREEGQTVSPTGLRPFSYPDSKLCDDTLTALRQLETVLAGIPAHGPQVHFSLEIRLYNCAPMALYVALDDRVFVEQYHLGIPTAQVQSPFTRCLGKSVPSIEVAKSSELGNVLASHFEYLWDRSVARTISVGSVTVVRESLRQTDWLGQFRRADADDETALRLSGTV